MSLRERAVLDANLSRLKAIKRLNEIEADPEKATGMHPDSLYDLAMEATGNEAVANAYRVAAIKSRWKAS